VRGEKRRSLPNSAGIDRASGFLALFGEEWYRETLPIGEETQVLAARRLKRSGAPAARSGAAFNGLAAQIAHGRMCLARGRAAEALSSFERAAVAGLNDANALGAAGDAAGVQACLGGALEALEAVTALRPKDAEAHNHRGIALARLGRFEEAVASLDRAIALAPDAAQPYYNRGLALANLRRLPEALESYERAIALNPGHATALNNRGSLLHDLGRFPEAIASYDAALAARPQFLTARLNRGITLLLTGQFEAVWKVDEQDEMREASGERAWTCDTVREGQRIFIRHEQGFGDTIQFCRYGPLLEARGAEVTMSVQAPLISLMRRLSPSIEVLDPDAPAPAFDLTCTLMSLPFVFGTRLETIPARPSYLSADPQRLSRFEALLGPKRRPRVALAWSGAARSATDYKRSIAFAQLTPLLREDVDWFGLQTDMRPADAAAFQDSGRARFLGDSLRDFEDTAAATALMDLVICVDTSLAHLAGALGKPVWILMPFVPDWRWLLGRSDSPWYPSARLFRQPALNDWTSVISEVGAALGEWRDGR